MIIFYLLAWIPMVFIGILNGVIREATYGKGLDELQAHQISTVTAVILLGSYILALTYFFPFNSALEAITVGFLWLILTVIFEFTFGHYVAKHSWQELLRDYNLFAGRVWLIVLLWILIAPLLFYRLDFFE